VTAARAPRPLPRWRRLVLRVATAVWRVLQSQPPAGYPLVEAGWPTGAHPESLTAELPGADEEYLAALAAGLWPADEYTEIVRPDPPEGGRAA